MAINVLDIGFGILVLLFVVRAILQGVVQELGGLIGIFLGFVVAGRMYQQLVPQFAGIVDNAFLAGLISYGILFAATLIVVALLSSLLKNFLAIALPGWLDSTLAACVGFAKGCFV